MSDAAPTNFLIMDDLNDQAFEACAPDAETAVERYLDCAKAKGYKTVGLQIYVLDTEASAEFGLISLPSLLDPEEPLELY